MTLPPFTTSYFPVVAAVLAVVIGYGSLITNVANNTAELKRFGNIQEKYGTAINRMDTYDLRLNSHSQDISRFLTRMDEFLKTQQTMNRQLVEINSRQGMILKQLETLR